ncbi:glycosyl hydrolase [uncultured Thermanaerothrix sp.]|uniref:glycosyl hydrolase n=1 Tax=uncultured Thermanaerothrix sp. TaxID=1195149 RepID=UPI00262607ED|nr:glycosyl hydrolase [uncultured Thermanaerothrix sp.]
MKQYWSKENVEKYLPEVDALADKQHTAVGWFIDIQDPAFYEDWETESALNRNNFYRQLEQLWQKGYISLIKIGSTDTARKIYEGRYDAPLSQMAKIYKRWIEQGGGRKAMLAPLQEMNGDWVAYYDDAFEPSDINQKLKQRQIDFKSAYTHIQDVFKNNGVDFSMVWWVFAPNGLSSPDVPENDFEHYYPGDDRVDLVGFASYNYGFCPATLSPACVNGDCGRWEIYDTIYAPYITRMQKMAPTKPILITETGSSAMHTKEDRDNNTYNYAKKAEWMVLNYGYLARQPMVLGVFYFDVNDFDGKVCDLGIPRENFDGYRQAVTGYQYLPTSVLDEYVP